MEADHVLMHKLAMGDTSALASLFDRYQDPLVRLLYQLTGTLDDAEELVQETFLQLLAQAPRYRLVRSFRAYLFKMALNLGRTHLRRKARRQKRNPYVVEKPAGSPLPDAEASRKETHDLIAQALQELSQEERLVVTLKEFEEMTFDEIALTLEVPVGTVKSRLRYALKKLAPKLKQLREP